MNVHPIEDLSIKALVSHLFPSYCILQGNSWDHRGGSQSAHSLCSYCPQAAQCILLPARKRSSTNLLWRKPALRYTKASLPRNVVNFTLELPRHTQWRTCLQPRIAPITFSIYETSPQVIPGILLSTILAITGGALDHPGDHEGELLGPFPFVAAGRWRCHRVRHRLSQLLGLHGAGEDDKFYWENTDIRVMREMVASCVQQDKREAEGSRSLQLCLGTSLQVG